MPWDTSEPPLRVLVVYYSRFGVIRQMAEEIAAGASRVDGVVTDLLQVEDAPLGLALPGETEQAMLRRRGAIVERLAEADAIVVGSPAYFGSMASPLKRLFEDCATAPSPLLPDESRPWRGHLFRNKVGAAFTSSATPHGGNEQTLHSILTMMMHLGMIVVAPGQREPILEHLSAPYGATAVTGATGAHELTEEERVQARDLGQRVAEVANWLDLGHRAWLKRRDLEEFRQRIGMEQPPRPEEGHTESEP